MADIETLFALLDELDGLGAVETGTVVTSVRQPAALRDALKAAVELGMASNPNEITVAAVRDRVEAFAQQLALEQHFDAYPHARPTLGDLAVAAAELDGHPLADDARLLRQCATELARQNPEATGGDVVTFAMGRRSATKIGG